MSSSLVLGFNNMSSYLCLPLPVFDLFSLLGTNFYIVVMYFFDSAMQLLITTNLVFAIFFIRVCIIKCLNAIYVVKLFTALMHYLPSLILKYVRVFNFRTFPTAFLEFKIL